MRELRKKYKKKGGRKKLSQHPDISLKPYSNTVKTLLLILETEKPE